jgi:hypothetical protein
MILVDCDKLCINNFIPRAITKNAMQTYMLTNNVEK